MYEKNKCRLRMLHALKPYAFGVKRFLLLNLIIGAAFMALGFIQPLFYKIFIDRVILGRKLSEIPLVVAGYLAVFVLGTGCLTS